MKPFADRLIDAVQRKGNPCIVGLDPRIDEMPAFVTSEAVRQYGYSPKAITSCIVEYHRRILDIVSDMVPAVKPQIAFYEQYAVAGMKAFEQTIRMAKERGLLVIVDAKRNDISSTALAYANSFLGVARGLDREYVGYDVDCITVSPYLGDDSIQPFVDTCRRFGKGIFVLVKTSNPGSKDFQDLAVGDSGEPLYRKVADMVQRHTGSVMGESGYSSIGAVVGATFPEEADGLRAAMRRSVFLVPGYGAQGGTAEGAAHCFNDDGLGAVVNASRSITYAFESKDISEKEFKEGVSVGLSSMIQEINGAIKAKIRENEKV